MIAIVNYGMGNLGSIANMLDRLEQPNVVTADVDVIAEVDGFILPGVGAFDRGMGSLGELGLIEPLTVLATKRRMPVLGICLGMQLLARGSEEGSLPGLGWIAGDVVRFDVPGLLVPHMGWNVVRAGSGGGPGGGGIVHGGDDDRFYFVHSYYLRCDDERDVIGWAHYGVDFAAAVGHGNVMGVQFHPEKSHRFGLALLGRFAALLPSRQG